MWRKQAFSSRHLSNAGLLAGHRSLVRVEMLVWEGALTGGARQTEFRLAPDILA